MRRRPRLAAACAAALLALAPRPSAPADLISLAFPAVDPLDLAPERTTAAGLYLTAAEAHAALDAHAPRLFVDVRPVADAERTGLAAGVDALIPLGEPAAFVERVGALARAAGRGRDDAIVLICARGLASARAADLLVEAGYTHVWSVVDGMEGGETAGPGWIASGLPLRVAPNRRVAPGPRAASGPRAAMIGN